MPSVFKMFTDTYPVLLATAADIKVDEDGYFPSKNIAAHSFTEFAIDNLDFHETTTPGKTMYGTTHTMSIPKKLNSIEHHWLHSPIEIKKTSSGIMKYPQYRTKWFKFERYSRRILNTCTN